MPTGPLGSAGPPQTSLTIFSCILERLTENWLPRASLAASLRMLAPSSPGRMRLTSRQSISPWRVTRRVLRDRSEQPATRRSSRRHRRSTVCAAVPHPSTKLPPRKTARSDALTIEMSALEARPPTAPESWLLSGISSPPWVRSRHTSHPTSQAGSARDSAPDTARAQTPYPSDNAWTRHRPAHTQITHWQI